MQNRVEEAGLTVAATLVAIAAGIVAIVVGVLDIATKWRQAWQSPPAAEEKRPTQPLRIQILPLGHVLGHLLDLFPQAIPSRSDV